MTTTFGRTLATAALAVTLGTALTLAPGTARSASPSGLEEMRSFARQLLEAGEYDDAVTAYEKIVAHSVEDPQSHYELAAALAFIRRYAQALESVETAVRLRPDDVTTRELAAVVYFHLRLFAKAFEATHRMAELGDVGAMYTLVDLYERGIGVEPDEALAFRWADAAADRQHLGAMELMAEIHREGRYGQPVDTALADAWERRREAALEAMLAGSD